MRTKRLASMLAVLTLLLQFPTAAAGAQATSGVVISEIFYNPDGQAEGHEFIELHNTTGTPIDVSGWQFLTGIALTFGPGTVIAADGYVVIAANAADFQSVFGFAPTAEFGGTLANGGESITLVDGSSTVADQVIYDDVAPWPLSADGGGDSLVNIDADLAADDPTAWVAGTPTPQVENDPNLDVVFSVTRGWFSSSQTVSLTASVPGATIVYNTTGSGTATQPYTGPITVADNGGVRVIQAQATLAGQASSLITHTYVFKPDTGAPVVATWPNGLAVAPGESEATRSFEFIAPPSTGLSPAWGNAGVRASEGGIDAGDSDKFFFRGAYGNPTLTGDLFGDNYYGIRPTTHIDQLFLRDEHLDGTHLRQIVAHDALLAAGQLSPHGRFVQYYRNGSDDGVRHMQERPEGGFMESYTGIDKDNWLAWSTHELTPGSGTPNGLGAETLGAPFGSWAQADASIDVEALIDYLLVQWQAKVSDYRNIKNFRIAGPTDFATGDGTTYRYHFFNWDMDLGYANDRYGRGDASDWGWAGYTSPDYVAHDLDGFIEFRLLGSDRIACAHFDAGPLTSAAFTPRLEARRQELVAAGGANEQSFVDGLETWIDERNTWLLNEYRSAGADTTVYGTFRPDRAPWKPPSDFTGPLLQADSPVDVAVSDGVLTISNPNGGQIYYRTDGGDPRTVDGALHSAAVLYSGPVGLLAGRHEIIARSFDSGESDPFQAWSPGCNEPEIIDVDVAGDPGAPVGDGLVINELHYNPPAMGTTDGDSFEFIELFNPTDAAINLSGFSFSQGVAYTFEPGTILEPGEYATIASSLTSFVLAYGSAPDGVYAGRLSDGGEVVTLTDAAGRTVDTVPYDDNSPWDVQADGLGPSLSLIAAHLDNSLAASWTTADEPAATPGAANQITLPVPGDVNCDGLASIEDALLIAQFTVGTRTDVGSCPLTDPATELHAGNGDLNANSTVDIADALLIAQCTVGINNGFCA